MILIRKIKNFYSEKKAKKLISYYLLSKLQFGKNVSLFRLKILREIDFDKITYSYENFREDFHIELLKYKEKKIIYQMLRLGYTMASYAKKQKLSSYESIENILKKGLDNVTYSKTIYLFELIDIEIDLSSFSKKDIFIYSNFCTIYGNKKALESFKGKYNIPYGIYYNPRNKKWNIGFDGWVFMKIKKQSSK